MNVVNFTDIRKNLKAELDRVDQDHDYTVIARRNASNAVVMSEAYFNQIMETMHLIKSPANATHLEKSIAQLRAGQAQERDLIE
ncbi:type II toxin-antitoxin system Phd/YefM family antitoxin [Thalassospira sp.]|uniref:type II toxin-antitoxin system Phd/YefM family antitoxin n=1 Tax=Thalassospira sp. TaxID=1912094 RepID=UPI002735B436|nr:type II toxin-antitoxin system Phd/YefM family antitoxin [Thalassospira sp.]MDP2699661.1 type II toxin-antitoxin system Phd/YefM family antitoxin [Thalassospira sp.]